MRETSIKGVQLLRALALAVRSEQDFGLVPNGIDIVGAFKKENAVPADAKQRLGYKYMLKQNGYGPLSLRQALNKIAHADPQNADFYIAPRDQYHDLLLFGDDRGERWFAAISILQLVKAIHSLPDLKIDSEAT